MNKNFNLPKAISFAISAHHNTNHSYSGDLPYSVHLALVAYYAQKYMHLLPTEDEEIKAEVLAACWNHDVIEDCRVTYNDLKQVTSTRVADLVYAVTNSKGRNRAERGDHHYYSGIVSTQFATFVKCCDRLANIRFSVEYGVSDKLAMYRKESQKFNSHLHVYQYDEMFAEMAKLLGDGK